MNSSIEEAKNISKVQNICISKTVFKNILEMKYTQEALGSILQIEIYDADIEQADIDACFSRIAAFEETYSRFEKGNFLWNLNETGKAPLSPELRSLIKLAQKIYQDTKGYFDITLLPLLENAGYGIYDERLPEILGSENIVLTETEIQLKNGVKIELGSLGKGYMLDVVSDMLQKNGYTRFTLNFGGDIKIVGIETIGLEDPLRTKVLLGEIVLENRAFAGSAGNKRQFGGEHHILNTQTGHAQNDKIAVFTTHRLGTFADAYSTALFACPLELSLKVLEKTPGLEALIIDAQGKIHVSRGFQEKMKLY